MVYDACECLLRCALLGWNVFVCKVRLRVMFYQMGICGLAWFGATTHVCLLTRSTHYQLLQVLNGNSYLVVVCGCSVLCCIYVVLCCSVIGFVWFGVPFLLWLLVCTYVRTYLSAWNVWPLALYLCSCSVLCSSGLIQCTNVFLPPDMWRLSSVVD